MNIQWHRSTTHVYELNVENSARERARTEQRSERRSVYEDTRAPNFVLFITATSGFTGRFHPVRRAV